MDLAKKQEFQDSVEKFLEEYKIYDLFDSLLKELLIDRPPHPLDYLIHKLEAKPRRRLFLVGGIGHKRRQVARELSSRFNIEKVFLQDHLKSEVKKSGKHCEAIQFAWNTGSFIPDSVILEIMMPLIEGLEKKEASYILEGFPRTRVQCLALQRAGVIPDRVVFIRPSRNEFDLGATEKISELCSHRPENQKPVISRAWQEFEYHMNGVRAAYGFQVHEVESSEDIPELSNRIFKIYLAKGRSKGPQKPPCVIVLGPPGSGRTSLAKSLHEKYGLTFISTNQLLRDQINKKTEAGRNAAATINTGERVPDYLIAQLVMNRLQEPDCRINGWVLDGYPKTVDQLQYMREFKVLPTHVIFLDCPDNLVYERTEKRRLDPTTGEFYSILHLPEDEDIRSRLIQLNEDTHEVVKKRLSSYKESLIKIHSEYSGISISVKSDQPLSTICDMASEAIEKSIKHDEGP
jgi:adenylate kinase